MNKKRIVAGLLSTAMCLSVLSGCGKEDEGKKDEKSAQTAQSSPAEESRDEKNDETDAESYPLIIRDADKNAEMTAIFFNTQTNKTEEVKMSKTGEDDTCSVFSCEGDPTAFNMFHLKYGDTETRDVTFNTFTEAWYLYERELLPCKKDRDYEENPMYKTAVLKFNGYDKNVHIWTPENYDPDSDVKYSVIVMLDGQTVIDAELDPGNNRSWSVAQHVTSMMDVTDNKAILVCVETMGSEEAEFSRDDELIPDLGFSDEIREKNGCKFKCKDFGDYLVNTVIPYVEENYNVYTDAAHRSICGSSLGGLASFYIGIDHCETFGTLGALSSSFSVGSEEQWASFLAPKMNKSDLPFIFMYDGSWYNDNGALSEMMNNNLIQYGYPKDKIVFCKYEPAEHNVPSWSAIYPQFLEAVFTQKLAAVKSGETVEYQDKSRLHPALDPALSDLSDEIENDTRPDHIKNYIFYDNSETKWENVHAYVWGGMPTNKVTGEVFPREYAEWPGIPMERIEGTDIYRLAVPMGVNSIIYNSGVRDADVAKGAVAYQTSDLVFSNKTCSGKIYKIDMSKEPKQGTGKAERTKFFYQEGTWVDYTD